MRYFVNEDCIGCGLCASICPEIFSMTDAGVAVAADRDATPEEEPAAEEARQSCPVEAIRIVGEDA